MGAHAVRLSNVDIDNALKNNDFEVLFQPIFDLGNGALARMETFVRWRHPNLGVLPPGAFISFFETQGRMSELTRYVLKEALSGYLDWRGPFAPGFSINLALSDLSDDAFVSHFSVLLREHDFPAELVTLECPMPPVDYDHGKAIEAFQRLAGTGARLAIEVRGRANDFLRTADPFPFAEIKTGGAAILRFARTVRGPGLSAISELLEIASAQNAVITAVGVEDQASLTALMGLGFAAAQGNHLGRVGDLKAFTPSRVNEVRELLGLEALEKSDLAALFRTRAPNSDAADEKLANAGKTSDSSKDGAAVQKPTLRKGPERRAPPAGGDIVDRLSARIRQEESRQSGEPIGDEIASAKAAPPAEQDTLEKAAARKAAAIDRIKKSVTPAAVEPSKPDSVESDDDEIGAEAMIDASLAIPDAPKRKSTSGHSRWASGSAQKPEPTAPHELQERLSREFEAFSSDFTTDAPEDDTSVESSADEHVDQSAPEADAFTVGVTTEIDNPIDTPPADEPTAETHDARDHDMNDGSEFEEGLESTSAVLPSGAATTGDAEQQAPEAGLTNLVKADSGEEKSASHDIDTNSAQIAEDEIDQEVADDGEALSGQAADKAKQESEFESVGADDESATLAADDDVSVEDASEEPEDDSSLNPVNTLGANPKNYPESVLLIEPNETPAPRDDFAEDLFHAAGFAVAPASPPTTAMDGSEGASANAPALDDFTNGLGEAITLTATPVTPQAPMPMATQFALAVGASGASFRTPIRVASAVPREELDKASADAALEPAATQNTENRNDELKSEEFPSTVSEATEPDQEFAPAHTDKATSLDADPNADDLETPAVFGKRAPKIDVVEDEVEAPVRESTVEPASHGSTTNIETGDLLSEIPESDDGYVNDETRLFDELPSRRENFLTRRYKMPFRVKIPPKHFWPKPVRKAMKRRAAERAAQDASVE